MYADTQTIPTQSQFAVAAVNEYGTFLYCFSFLYLLSVMCVYAVLTSTSVCLFVCSPATGDYFLSIPLSESKRVFTSVFAAESQVSYTLTFASPVLIAPPPQPPPEPISDRLPLILGLCAGGGAAVLLAAALLVWRRQRQQLQQQGQTSQSSQSESPQDADTLAPPRKTFIGAFGGSDTKSDSTVIALATLPAWRPLSASSSSSSSSHSGGGGGGVGGRKLHTPQLSQMPLLWRTDSSRSNTDDNKTDTDVYVSLSSSHADHMPPLQPQRRGSRTSGGSLISQDDSLSSDITLPGHIPGTTAAAAAAAATTTSYPGQRKIDSLAAAVAATRQAREAAAVALLLSAVGKPVRLPLPLPPPPPPPQPQQRPTSASSLPPLPRRMSVGSSPVVPRAIQPPAAAAAAVSDREAALTAASAFTQQPGGSECEYDVDAAAATANDLSESITLADTDACGTRRGSEATTATVAAAAAAAAAAAGSGAVTDNEQPRVSFDSITGDWSEGSTPSTGSKRSASHRPRHSRRKRGVMVSARQHDIGLLNAAADALSVSQECQAPSQSNVLHLSQHRPLIPRLQQALLHSLGEQLRPAHHSGTRFDSW